MKQTLEKNFKFIATVLVLGMSLTAYAFTNFATKDELKDIKAALIRIEGKIDRITIPPHPHP